MSRKKTTETFIQEARAVHEDRYDYSLSDYTGAHEKLLIVCREHGEFLQRAHDHVACRKGCPACANERSSESRRFTATDFISKARASHGDRYDYSRVVYQNSKEKVFIICPDHGQFEQVAGKHVRGHGCPKCRTGRRPAKAAEPQSCGDRWVCKARKVHAGKDYDYSNVRYISSHRDVEIVCRKHGAFTQSPSNHIVGHGCPECGQEESCVKRVHSVGQWVEKFQEAHPGDLFDYTELPQDIRASSKVPITCKKHGRFLQVAATHAQGTGCPRCCCRVSKAEAGLAEWVQEILPGAAVIKGDRKVLAPYELDIWVPSKRVAVEFNGSFWHSSPKKSAAYHQKKSLSCARKGIQLIHVYEFDYEEKAELYRSIIRHKLGVDARRIGARSLLLKTVSAAESAVFLQENHFQGSCPGSHRFGLFLGEELLAVAVFGAARFDKEAKFELLRLCTRAGYTVPGAATRLLRAFERACDLRGESLVSYARLDYSNGQVYAHLGFERSRVCKPGYVWVSNNGNQVISRYQAQKHRLVGLLGEKFDPEETEDQNMTRASFHKVFTAGSIRFLKRYPGEIEIAGQPQQPG